MGLIRRAGRYEGDGRLPRAYERFWWGQTASLLGNAISQFAIPLYAVESLHVGPQVLGWMVACSNVVVFLAPFLIADIVDRYPRNGLIAVTEVMRAAAVIVVAYGMFTATVSVEGLIAYSLVAALLTSVSLAGIFSVVPDIVEPPLRTRANARMHASHSVATVIGPAIAGSAVVLVGAAWMLLLDGLSFLVSAVSALTLPRKEGRAVATKEDVNPHRSGEAVSHVGMIARLRRRDLGFKVMVQHPVLRGILLSSALYNMSAATTMTLTVIFVLETLHLEAATYGIAAAAGGIGSLVGAFVVSRLTARFHLRLILSGCLAAAGLARGFIATLGYGPLWDAIGLGAALAVSHGAIAMYGITGGTYRQRVVPRELLGRSFTAYRAITQGAMPLAAVAAGAFAAATSSRLALGVAAGVALAAAIALAYTTRGHANARLDDPEESNAGEGGTSTRHQP